MSEKHNRNSWFENKKNNTENVWTKQKNYFHQGIINKRDIYDKSEKFINRYLQQNKQSTVNKEFYTYPKDNKYLQVDKNNSWNMRNQKPYKEDRYKFDKAKHEHFHLILGKFYQRKKSVKYRDMKWDHHKAIEKQKEEEYMAHLRKKIDVIKDKIDTSSRDELMAMKDEVVGYMKKLASNDSVDKALANNIITNNRIKAIYINEEEAIENTMTTTKENTDVIITEETNVIEKEIESIEKQKISETSTENDMLSISQFEQANREYETDLLLREYFEHTQPDLLQDEFHEVYVHNHLENANMLSNKNTAPTSITVQRIEYTKIREIVIPKEKKWTKKDDELFVKELRNTNKDFTHVYCLLGKDIKEIILHYYRTKKRSNIFNKRRGGRISDDEMRVFVERNWDNKSINAFVNLFYIHGNNWEYFEEKFPRRSLKEFKLLYRYLNKFEKERLERKVVKQVKDENELRIKYQKEFTTCEKQVFAMYYPFVGRNWIEMAQVCNKSVNEVRGYYRHYYKKLSVAEKQFESMMKDYDRDILSCFKRKNCSQNTNYNDKCGIIFTTSIPKNNVQ